MILNVRLQQFYDVQNTAEPISKF